MKIKWSGIGMVDGRGKINGSVASKNRAGAYVRTKVTPVNRRSTAQQAVRSTFGFIAQQWRRLTDVQRQAWGGAVGNFTNTDIFGDIKSPSGFNLFSKLNLPLINTTGGWNVNPPTAVEVPIAILDSFTVNLSNATPFSVILADNELNEGGGILVVDATPSLSPGVNFVKSQYRRIHHQVVTDASAALSLSLLSDYTAVFGDPVVGEKIFIRVSFIAGSGQIGVPVQMSTIIVDNLG